MPVAPQSVDELIEQLVAWGEHTPDIRAMVIIGSRARTDVPADEWSDLDLLLVTTDPRRYQDQVDWLEQFGPYWATFLEPTMGGGRERRVLFAGARDVDFVPLSPEMVEAETRNGVLPLVATRGSRVLLDKDGQVTRLLDLPAPPPPDPLPDEAEYLNVVNDFFYHCMWTVKKVHRGELWVARSCCDGYMKRLLLWMIEWQARSSHGSGYDTWFDGRFLERWADPRVVGRLSSAFAHYDRADVERALVSTMGLFRSLAREVAARLGYRYPAEVDERLTEWVQREMERTSESANQR